MKAYAVLPSGDTIPLIDIPNWDFSWQGFYDFRSPIHFPQGTVVHGFGTYDNTLNNPNNPNDPPQLVTLGEATTDEMMLFYFAYTPGVASDSLIVIDDGSGPDYYMDCNAGTTVGIGNTNDASISVWPSPTRDRLFVEGIPVNSLVQLRDAQGKLVATINASNPLASFDVSGQTPGMYVVEITDTDGTMRSRSKVLVE